MKLEIRKLQLEDITFLNEVRNECREYLHNNIQYSIQESVDWFHNLKTPYYLITLGDQKIGYFRTDQWKSDGSVQIGADLHKDFRGRGLAKAAYYLFLDYLFNVLDIDMVHLEVLKTNERAISLYEALDFTPVQSISSPPNSIRMELWKRKD